ncbi:hypothetical protein GCM10022212_11960 [Actimicrobium antarcticum]|uniref:Uncharacterized protein n=2 Tax=Actimicrobium antarcticum TaxID=1051899 RepID=A0ABP7SXT0_9BURK
MSLTNAERQALYRQRHLRTEDSTGELLHAVINLHAKRALERLAKCYGLTQRALLERLLIDAERQTIDSAGRLPNGQADYYDGRLRLEISRPDDDGGKSSASR